MPGASVNPQDFSSGTIFEEGVYTFRRPRFEVFDYDGKADRSLSFAAVLVGEDGTEHEQHWSAGKLDRFQPSLDGDTPSPTGEGPYACAMGNATSLNQSTNVYPLMVSYVNGAEDKAAAQKRLADAKGNMEAIFDGLQAKVVWQDQAARAGLQTIQGGGASDRKRQVPVIDHIVALPGQSPATAPGAGAAAKNGRGTKAAVTATAPMATPSADGEIIAQAAQEFLMNFLSESGGRVTRTALLQKAFVTLPANIRAGATSWLNQPANLESFPLVRVEGAEIVSAI